MTWRLELSSNRTRPESGHAAVELALGIGLLLLPAAVLVLGFGPWSERTVLATSAAAEGSRAAVIALSVEAGSVVVAEMAENFGLSAGEVRVGWCGASPAASGGGDCSFVRGAAVEAVVEVWVPLITTPWGQIGGVWVSRSHVENIDLYRSLG